MRCVVCAASPDRSLKCVSSIATCQAHSGCRQRYEFPGLTPAVHPPTDFTCNTLRTLNALSRLLHIRMTFAPLHVTGCTCRALRYHLFICTVASFFADESGLFALTCVLTLRHFFLYLSLSVFVRPALCDRLSACVSPIPFPPSMDSHPVTPLFGLCSQGSRVRHVPLHAPATAPEANRLELRLHANGRHAVIRTVHAHAIEGVRVVRVDSNGHVGKGRLENTK